MFRRKVGFIAIGLISVGCLLLLIPSEGRNMEALRGGCLSIGIGMSLLWLAEPQLRKVPYWLPITLVVAAGLLLARPKLIPMGLAAVAILWLIRPRRNE